MNTSFSSTADHAERVLVQEAISIVGNALAGEEARLRAFEALSYLLEPVDNANGEPSSCMTLDRCM